MPKVKWNQVCTSGVTCTTRFWLPPLVSAHGSMHSFILPASTDVIQSAAATDFSHFYVTVNRHLQCMVKTHVTNLQVNSFCINISQMKIYDVSTIYLRIITYCLPLSDKNDEFQHGPLHLIYIYIDPILFTIYTSTKLLTCYTH